MAYTKTLWAVGTTGTAALMNKIEDGIAAVDAAITTIQATLAGITAIGNQIITATDAAAVRSAISAAASTHTHPMTDVTGLNAAIAGSLAFINYGSGTPPLRSTVTTDPNRVVFWIGTTAPPTTTGYALPIDKQLIDS